MNTAPIIKSTPLARDLAGMRLVIHSKETFWTSEESVIPDIKYFRIKLKEFVEKCYQKRYDFFDLLGKHHHEAAFLLETPEFEIFTNGGDREFALTHDGQFVFTWYKHPNRTVLLMKRLTKEEVDTLFTTLWVAVESSCAESCPPESNLKHFQREQAKIQRNGMRGAIAMPSRMHNA